MTTAETSIPGASEKKGFTQKMLDGIEKLGNKVPIR